MSDDKSEGGTAKDGALKIGLELVKQTYEDGPRAVVQELGKLAVRPLKLLNACFANIDLAIQDHEGRQRLLEQRMREKWNAIPSEHLVAPPANIAGPLLLNYVFVQEAGAEPLRDLYEQLLATSMDSAEQSLVHPSFVDMLRQMTPAEAKVMRFLGENGTQAIVLIEEREHGHFGTIERGHHHGLPSDVIENSPESFALIENLDRLGLLEIRMGISVVDSTDPYGPIAIAALERYEHRDGFQLFSTNGIIRLTTLGKRFVHCCVTRRSPSR